MLSFLRDKLQTARLKARYQRRVQERLLQLVEATGPQPVADDPGDWTALGDGKPVYTDLDRTTLRDKARDLVAKNPHARNVLRLMEVYVVGPGLRLDFDCGLGNADCGLKPDQSAIRIPKSAIESVWRKFLEKNRRHFSYAEFARRTWRDGECFLRLFPNADGIPAVRFVDPELIAGDAAHPESHGIVTDDRDVETPTAYLRIDPATGRLVERIPAEQMLHTRINVDSNQKRGVTFFSALIDPLSRFDDWLNTELTARKLQASIVLWRRVQGSPSRVTGLADSLDTGDHIPPLAKGGSGGVATRSERYKAGTILTTSQGTELQFLQPDTNFGDAASLGRMMLLCAAAGAGLPEFMLTSDASNANFASTLVAEGPAVKLFEREQRFFAGEFERLWLMVMSEALSTPPGPPLARGGIAEWPADILESVTPTWTFPNLVSRDRPKERAADVKLVQSQVLSRAEVARRDDADPELMRREIAEERTGEN